MKDTGGSRQEVSPKSAGSAHLCVRVLLFRSTAGRRQCWHFIPKTSRVELVARTCRSAWGGSESEKSGMKIRMEKTISKCFPGTESDKDHDLGQREVVQYVCALFSRTGCLEARDTLQPTALPTPWSLRLLNERKT